MSDLLSKALRYRWLIFWILAFAYILVYFHRLCPAVVAVDMMRDLHAGGALLGLLGSAYFYPYALMQLPAGLLSDSWGPRRTITLFFVIAFMGSLLLALAPSLFWAIVGRTLVGQLVLQLGDEGRDLCRTDCRIGQVFLVTRDARTPLYRIPLQLCLP